MADMPKSTGSFFSSQVTDPDSEDEGVLANPPAVGNAMMSQQRPLGRQAGAAGAAVEPSQLPSRSSSAATGYSSRRGRSQANPAGRGVPPSIAGSTTGTNTRPPTSHSRTHVPSLTAQAFFRPMSSQRLQAQRGQRPSSFLAQNQPMNSDVQNDSARNNNRQSLSSTTHIRGGPGLLHMQITEGSSTIRPLSRESDLTDMPDYMPDRNTFDTSPNRPETLQSHNESETPLRGEAPAQLAPPRLDLGKTFKAGSATLPPPQKSPRSFRSSFILPARNSRGGNSRSSLNLRPQGHEKLESEASSPRETPLGELHEKNEALGRNYEYFSGNTKFFLGGRIQNTRDKPISIATCFLTILPGPLFLAQS